MSSTTPPKILRHVPAVQLRKSCSIRGHSLTLHAHQTFPVLRFFVATEHVLIMAHNQALKLHADLFCVPEDSQLPLTQHPLWVAERSKGVDVVDMIRFPESPVADIGGGSSFGHMQPGGILHPMHMC